MSLDVPRWTISAGRGQHPQSEREGAGEPWRSVVPGQGRRQPDSATSASGSRSTGHAGRRGTCCRTVPLVPERQGPDSCWSGASQADPCTPARPASVSRQPASPRVPQVCTGQRGEGCDPPPVGLASAPTARSGVGRSGGAGAGIGLGARRGGPARHIPGTAPARCAIRRATAPTRRICTRTPHTRPWPGLSVGLGSTAPAQQPQAGCLAGGARSRQQPPALPCPQRGAHPRCPSHTAASEPSHGQDSLGPRGCRPAWDKRGLSDGRDAGAVPAGRPVAVAGGQSRTRWPQRVSPMW